MEELVYFGDTVKVLGDNKVGGYLVRFSDDGTPDLEGDYFDAKTYLGIESGSSLPVFYHHGYDSVLKSRPIGRGQAKIDDVGVWFEAQLDLRDEYEKRLMELARAGKLGWSSGAAGHLVDRELTGKSYHITSWPIAEASLTPTPAEPRNTAVNIKTLLQSQTHTQTQKEATMAENTTAEVKTPQVDLEKLNAMFAEQNKKAVSDGIAEGVERAMKALRDAEAEVKAGVQVVEDEADKALRENPFKMGEFFQAVWRAEMQPYNIDKRLLPLKAATGNNENIPADGGFLVQTDLASSIHEHMWGVGTVLGQFTPTQISPNSNSLKIPAVDETSRADGSRMGGVRGYWLAEASTATSSKPTFRQISLELKKVAALTYATDELLQDASALGSWIANNVPNELRFLVEDAIIDGDGVGKPLGIIQAGCLIQSTRADANKIADEDVSGMWSHRYTGVNDYVWFANQSIMPQLYAMTVGDQPVYLPPGGLSGNMYGTLMGRPVIETEYNPYLGSVGDLLLASPSQYALITKGGTESASSIHVNFDKFETAFRFLYRVDGEPLWASSVTAYDGTNTISPFVALAATT